MRRKILVVCLSLLSTAMYAQQQNAPVRKNTPFKSGTTVTNPQLSNRNPSSYYGDVDTSGGNRFTRTSANTPLGGNPLANRFEAIDTKCDGNSMLFKWTAIQQNGADKYEIEQSADGRHWQTVGVVPANRTDMGEASYSFRYNKNIQGAVFRIKATSIGGDYVYSSNITAPCSNATTSVAVTPNPIRSAATVRITSPVSGKVDVAILDTKGAMVHSSDASLLQGPNNLPLDMSRLPAGYYSLVIRWSSGRQEVVRLVKQ